MNTSNTIEKRIESRPRSYGKSTLVTNSFLSEAKSGKSVIYKHPNYICLSQKALKNLKQSTEAETRKQTEEKNMRLEGLSATIKFIRNKARRDIMKADMYGQGYYRCIKDLEDYFGIQETEEE